MAQILDFIVSNVVLLTRNMNVAKRQSATMWNSTDEVSLVEKNGSIPISEQKQCQSKAAVFFFTSVDWLVAAQYRKNIIFVNNGRRFNNCAISGDR